MTSKGITKWFLGINNKSTSSGEANQAQGNFSVVSGGDTRTAPGIHDWVAGSLFENF